MGATQSTSHSESGRSNVLKIDGHGFAQNGSIETLRSPGYPFFVAMLKVITGSYFGITLIQIILVFGSAVILRRIGQLFISKQVGEIAAVFLISSPVTLALSLTILTDILFLFFFIFGFYLSLSSKKENMFLRVVLVSIIFSAAIYVRPMGFLAFPIFIVPFLASSLIFKEKLKSIGLLIFLIIIILSPWVIRNYALTGVADFTSFKSANLVSYAAPMFLAHIHGTTLEQEREILALKIGIPVSSWYDLRFSKALNKAAEKVILEQPLDYLWYHIASSLPFLFSSSIEYVINFYKSVMHIQSEFIGGSMRFLLAGDWKSFIDNIFRVWWKVIERVLWLTLYLFAIVGIWTNRKSRSTWTFVFVILYLMFLAGPVGDARYALPTLPFTFLFVSAGIVYLFKNGYLGMQDSFLSRSIKD